jgi:hypothetical protein
MFPKSFSQWYYSNLSFIVILCCTEVSVCFYVNIHASRHVTNEKTVGLISSSMNIMS